VVIAIDRYRAGLMNVDVNTIINRVSEKLQGTEGGQMEVKGDLTDITVRMNEITLKELESMTIKVNNTEVLLREVAQIRVGNSPREILHNNQNRIVE
jgi:HAE1 family hydrophobic/amphiphilic exporter-1